MELRWSQNLWLTLIFPQLGDDFMQALQLLDTTFKLPDTSRNLSKSLGVWRKKLNEFSLRGLGKSLIRSRLQTKHGGRHPKKKNIGRAR